MDQSYFIIIPTWLFNDDKIPWKLKKLYGIIVSLTKKEGYCWATNKWLAEQIKVDERTIQRYLSRLKEWDLIKSTVLNEEGNIRHIVLAYPFGKSTSPSHDTDVTPSRHVERGNVVTSRQKKPFLSPIYSKDKVNMEKSNFSLIRNEIISHFISKVKEIKGFEPVIDWGKETKLIKYRLTKFTPDELKEVIDNYLKSEDIERLGPSLSACLSNNFINKWQGIKKRNAWRYGE